MAVRPVSRAKTRGYRAGIPASWTLRRSEIPSFLPRIFCCDQHFESLWPDGAWSACRADAQRVRADGCADLSLLG